MPEAAEDHVPDSQDRSHLLTMALFQKEETEA